MKNIAFFLLFFLLVSGHSNANAVGGSIGGWRITSNVAQGIGAKITATKDVIVNGASKAVTSSATVLPKAANVGKFIGKNFAASAVIGAVDLLLDGVDYVMDPVNNTVTYKPKGNYGQYIYRCPSNYYCSGQEFNSAESFAKFLEPTLTLSSCSYSSGIGYCTYTNGRVAYYDRVNNPAYNPEKDEKKTVPISDVASQVLDQAEEDIKAGNVASPAVVLSRAVAQDMVQEAEADDTKARPIATELDKNTSYPSDTDIEGEITTPEVVDPVTGEVIKPAETSSIAMQFPKACEWFPQLCLFIDWMQKPQELDEPDLPTKEIEKKEIDEELIKISSSSCPAPIDVNIPLPVFNTTYTDSISVSEYCPKIEKLAPVLQLLAFVLAIMIIKDI